MGDLDNGASDLGSSTRPWPDLIGNFPLPSLELRKCIGRLWVNLMCGRPAKEGDSDNAS